MPSIPMTQLSSAAEPAPAEGESTEIASTSFVEKADGTAETVNGGNGEEEECVEDDQFDEEGNAIFKPKRRRPKVRAVDLQGYVIIVVTTKDNKTKLYGSPSTTDEEALEVADEILDVNETILENMTRDEAIDHIHECIQSCLIKLRVKRQTEAELEVDLSNIAQDAFLIAVEQQARERLQRLSALKKIQPVDMSKLSIELNKTKPGEAVIVGNHIDNLKEKLLNHPPNGIIPHSVIVTKINGEIVVQTKPITSSPQLKPKSPESTPSSILSISTSTLSPALTNGNSSDIEIGTTEAIIESPRSCRDKSGLNEAIIESARNGWDNTGTTEAIIASSRKGCNKTVSTEYIIESARNGWDKTGTTEAIIESARNGWDKTGSPEAINESYINGWDSSSDELIRAIIERNGKNVDIDEDAEPYDDIFNIPEPLTNGNVELLLGELPDNKVRATVIIENHGAASEKG